MKQKLPFINQLLVLVLIYCTYGSEASFRLGRTGKYGLVPPPEGVAAGGNVMVKEKWFTQRLDHFNNTDTRTWSQVC